MVFPCVGAGHPISLIFFPLFLASVLAGCGREIVVNRQVNCSSEANRRAPVCTDGADRIAKDSPGSGQQRTQDVARDPSPPAEDTVKVNSICRTLTEHPAAAGLTELVDTLCAGGRWADGIPAVLAAGEREPKNAAAVSLELLEDKNLGNQTSRVVSLFAGRMPVAPGEYHNHHDKVLARPVGYKTDMMETTSVTRPSTDKVSGRPTGEGIVSDLLYTTNQTVSAMGGVFTMEGEHVHREQRLVTEGGIPFAVMELEQSSEMLEDLRGIRIVLATDETTSCLVLELTAIIAANQGQHSQVVDGVERMGKTSKAVLMGIR